jgi:hypothetical protein
MALRVAVANGNWSNPAIWNNGVLPGANDIVASNNFTVTIDQNVTVDRLSNAVTAPQILSAPMTGYTTPSGIVTASSFLYDAFLPWYAFDQGFSDWLSSTFNPPQWLAYEFPVLRTVKIYQVVPSGQNAPQSVARDWTFEAWNGTSWVVLDTVTGNSGTATVTRTLTNTTAYIKYRINITANNGNAAYVGIAELRMYEANDYMVNSVAGGGFIANSSVTITCTSLIGITGGSATAPLTVSAASPAVVNVNSNLTNFGVDSSRVIAKTGNCTLNIVGSTRMVSSGSARHCLVIFSTGTTNFLGGVTGAWAGSHGILMTTGSAGAILNIVGDINPTKAIFGAQNVQHLVVNTVCTVNVTGNIYGGAGNDAGISVGAGATIYVTGNVYGGHNISNIIGAGAGIVSGQAHFLSVIGTIYAQHTPPFETSGVHSTSSGAINLFSGPFVSGPYGSAPLTCTRMHLIPTTNSYFEFRDETTNGALSPGAIAPATRLVSPATLVDNLAVSDVRFGTTYALGTLTGTLRMPTANQVTYGVAVDNTFGNAVLTAGSVWDYLVANITVENSIGMRLKNVSTPQTTGEQLEAFLRLE